ncbi:MAG: hypothetical protein DME97_02305 [Verrucomicrobia bacterium]|nr:MAG: hypothetical protein DME97_02305 [Verrucomicrobiota bacterium]
MTVPGVNGARGKRCDIDLAGRVRRRERPNRSAQRRFAAAEHAGRFPIAFRVRVAGVRLDVVDAVLTIGLVARDQGAAQVALAHHEILGRARRRGVGRVIGSVGKKTALNENGRVAVGDDVNVVAEVAQGGFQIDCNRKRAMCVILEEHIIEEGLLNGRELLVLPWLREAKTNEEIGIILGMKTATVKKHVHRILEKLGVENRTAAAFYANRSFTDEA